MKKLIYYWNYLISTFWFVPVLIMLGAIVLATITLLLDSHFMEYEMKDHRIFLTVNTNSAKTILSVISGAMISVAGTVFSVTLVVLSLASSQFGFQVIKKFMNERINQIVLGSYVSLFLFCLIVLYSIKENEEALFVPSVSILVALVATFVNIVLLIIYIHNVASNVQVDNVISGIFETIKRNAKAIYHLDETETDGMAKFGKEADFENAKKSYTKQHLVVAEKNGYLQYINEERLIEIATSKNRILELMVRNGDYVVEGKVICKVYISADEKEPEYSAIRNQFLIGKTRTSKFDLEFSIQQMVQIAVKALSPGVNDPYTAMSCIDYLTATLSYLTRVKIPSKYLLDQEGDLRVVVDTTDFEGMLDTAFNQIRQYAAGNTAVIIRLMESLTEIYNLTKKGDNKSAIKKHAKMVLNVAKASIKEKNDFEDLAQRAKLILQIDEDMR